MVSPEVHKAGDAVDATSDRGVRVVLTTVLAILDRPWDPQKSPKQLADFTYELLALVDLDMSLKGINHEDTI